MNTSYRRGDVFLVNFGHPFGSEQGGTRPAVIIQNDVGNYYSPTLIVVPLTTSQKNSGLPTHVHFLFNGIQNIALCEQIRTIDKKRIIHRMGETQVFLGTISTTVMDEIDRSIKVSISLK